MDGINIGRALRWGHDRVASLLMTAFPCILVQMSAEQIIKEIKALTPGERAEVFKKTLPSVCPQGGKVIERLLRRLENPDIPEDVWRGIEDAEDGRLLDMETALNEKPPAVS